VTLSLLPPKLSDTFLGSFGKIKSVVRNILIVSLFF
jgi:hypothetical protein